MVCKARENSQFPGPGYRRGCSPAPGCSALAAPGPSFVALPLCPALGCCTCSPLPCSHQVCEPLVGRDPGSTVHSPRPGQPAVREDVRPHRPVAVSKPRSHEVRRRKAAEFWYCCCSWCCESGRRAAHPLTRLFHDTRVASYPFSPGEPRGTRGTRGRGRGRGGGGGVMGGATV